MRHVDESLRLRIGAAVNAASVSRVEVGLEWPECHRAKCQARHGDIDHAMWLMKRAVLDAIDSEIQFESTTRPDIAMPGDTDEETAVYTLATLLNRYNVHHAGTFVKAARLMIDTYPRLVAALVDVEPDDPSVPLTSTQLVSLARYGVTGDHLKGKHDEPNEA